MTAAAFTATMTDAVRTSVRYAERQTTAGHVVGGCNGCHAAIAMPADRDVTVLCPGCGTPVQLAMVMGSLTEDVCDGSCMSARGKICSCSCGGANHGGGWTVRILPTWSPAPGAQYPRVEYVDQSAPATAARKRAAVTHKRKTDANRQSAADRRAAREAAERLAAEAGRADLLATHPVLAALVTDEYAPAPFDPSASRWEQDRGLFVASMREAFERGDMTPRQAEAAVRMIERDRARTAERAARDAQQAAAVAAGVRVAAGRQTIRGTVTRTEEETYGPSWRPRHRIVITVTAADGCRYQGTLPEGLKPEWTEENRTAFVGWGNRIRGQRVTLVATVKPSDRDALFGFFGTPTVPAGTVRLSHIGPDDQAPDAPVPAPAAPRRPRTTVPAVVEPAPVDDAAADPWGAVLD